MAFACASSAALPSDQLTGPGRAQTLVLFLCEATLVLEIKSLNFLLSVPLSLVGGPTSVTVSN